MSDYILIWSNKQWLTTTIKRGKSPNQLAWEIMDIPATPEIGDECIVQLHMEIPSELKLVRTNRRTPGKYIVKEFVENVDRRTLVHTPRNPTGRKKELGEARDVSLRLPETICQGIIGIQGDLSATSLRNALTEYVSMKQPQQVIVTE